MKSYFKVCAVIGISLVVSATLCKAQDIIVKNDKTEIKSRVIEITDAFVKYKKWENIEGPVYNIALNEVFIIIYANGQKDIIHPPQPSGAFEPSIQSSTEIPSISSGSGTNNKKPLTDPQELEPQVKTKDQIVNYSPMRIMIGLSSPLSFGVGYDFKLIKNILNFGSAYIYTFPKDDYILQIHDAFIYASLFAPLNRLTGKYQNQDNGLFVFGNAGVIGSSVSTMDFMGNIENTGSWGFSWQLGADYFFSDTFGINISTFRFRSVYGGLSIKF